MKRLATRSSFSQPFLGHVQLPSNQGQKSMYFLPQSSYLTFGSLRDQITYPSLASNNESELIQRMARAMFYGAVH